MKYKKKFSAAVLALAATVSVMLTFSSCTMSGDRIAAEGKKLYNNGSYEEALEQFSAAQEKGLKNFKEAELYYLMGNCFYRLENYGTCIEYQKKCLEIAPEHFSSWVSLGVAYRKIGERDKALECYQTALEYDPQDTDSATLYISLGSVYIETNKPMSAVEYLEKAQELYHDSADVYAYLAIAYKMALEPEKSADALAKAQALGYSKIDEINDRLEKLNK
ncbi:MAG: tetratricopeptide repeat protein [Oscillospiraceae bacterium]|nr:tetratricopeptide repeat protein [Oscillospiraceae bacterium]